MSTVNPYVFLICLWPVAFLVIWAVWNSFRDSRDEKLVLRSLEWPEVQGKVISARVAWAHVEVCYEYEVQGIRYTGKYDMSLTSVVPDKYARGATQLNNEASEDIAHFPPGQTAIIRYNPLGPEESVFYCSGGSSTAKAAEADITPEFHTLG
jgi:hypothetical protein